MKRINVLSLFDGMACGMLAFQKAGIAVDNYYAYEIDKYAVQTATHNFPQIQECGDVFKGDYTQYEGIDYLIGGSVCTYWSIAQSPDKRETTASGIGWDMFSQYVRALKEAEPKYFIYENNKSMANAIRQAITKTFGFEAICINSALVSAQNRQRLYWVGKRNADGTYSKVDVQQPEDRGILLRDVLDCYEPVNTTTDGKSYALTTTYYKVGTNPCSMFGEEKRRPRVAEPVNVTADGKAQCLRATCYKDGVRNIAGNDIDKKTGVAEPVCIASRGRYSDTDSRSSKTDAPTYQHYEARTDGKTNAVTTVSKDNLIGEPVCMRYERSERAKQLRKDYESGKIKHGYHEFSELHPRQDGKTNTLSTVQKDNPICEPVRCFTLPREDGVQTQSKQYRVYNIDGKTTTLCAEGGGMGAKTGLYAVPLESGKELTENEMDYMVRGHSDRRWNHCQRPKQDEKAKCLVANIGKGVPYNVCAIPVEFDGEIPVKAVSGADGKTYTVYEVKDSNITIKGKTYPIKLVDGYYIIRKLTVSECKRLQTVPEWYRFPVSDTQAYKMLGNGWTVDVIVHLIVSTKSSN